MTSRKSVSVWYTKFQILIEQAVTVEILVAVKNCFGNRIETAAQIDLAETIARVTWNEKYRFLTYLCALDSEDVYTT